jgi:hypothetical protein
MACVLYAPEAKMWTYFYSSSFTDIQNNTIRSKECNQPESYHILDIAKRVLPDTIHLQNQVLTEKREEAFHNTEASCYLVRPTLLPQDIAG